MEHETPKSTTPKRLSGPWRRDNPRGGTQSLSEKTTDHNHAHKSLDRVADILNASGALDPGSSPGRDVSQSRHPGIAGLVGAVLGGPLGAARQDHPSILSIGILAASAISRGTVTLNLSVTSASSTFASVGIFMLAQIVASDTG